MAVFLKDACHDDKEGEKLVELLGQVPEHGDMRGSAKVASKYLVFSTRRIPKTMYIAARAAFHFDGRCRLSILDKDDNRPALAAAGLR